MEVATIETDPLEVNAKWRDYVKLYKETKNPMYKDLREVYRAAKDGKKLIDLRAVIHRAGKRYNAETKCYEPQFAIVSASAKTVCCYINCRGELRYSPEHPKHHYTSRADIRFDNMFPYTTNGNGYHGVHLRAPVPMIPHDKKPENIYPYHYILWQVDVWKIAPSKDPFLLRKLTDNIYTIEEHWELTDLEIAVMAEYL